MRVYRAIHFKDSLDLNLTHPSSLPPPAINLMCRLLRLLWRLLRYQYVGSPPQLILLVRVRQVARIKVPCVVVMLVVAEQIHHLLQAQPEAALALLASAGPVNGVLGELALALLELEDT